MLIEQSSAYEEIFGEEYYTVQTQITNSVQRYKEFRTTILMWFRDIQVEYVDNTPIVNCNGCFKYQKQLTLLDLEVHMKCKILNFNV